MTTRKKNSKRSKDFGFVAATNKHLEKATKEREGSHRIEGAHAAKTLSRVNEDDGSVISPGVLTVYIFYLFIVFKHSET